MFCQNCIVVSPEVFDDLFRKDALIAEFESSSDEVEYERRDSFLIHLINQVVELQFTSEDTQALCVGDDWWPNHTRYITAAPNHCTSAFLTALRCLLTDQYEFYRIQICVCESLSDTDVYIGSIAIYADRMVIESKLFQKLTNRCGD